MVRMRAQQRDLPKVLHLVSFRLMGQSSGREIPAVKYATDGATPLSIMSLLLYSYVPKKHTVPQNDPRNAGCTPP